jgi:ABC-type multidrug transport system fused ATPase/permease subunit
MKNFARLVRFAWPYRVRFGLSLVCATLVAALGCASISAVYPLLKILFYESENCQKWVAQKIDTLRTESRVIETRLAELDYIGGLGLPLSPAVPETLRDHFRRVHRDRNDRREALGRYESEMDVLTPVSILQHGPHHPDPNELERLRKEFQVADARLNELNRFSARHKQEPQTAADLNARRAELRKERAANERWIARYAWLEPRINRYLPHDGFQTLLLLLGLVMAGIALKGLFLFLQEVLVADVMQLTLFDIRNLFFRRTIALDLSSFGDQGSSELMSRFTNDMDSLSQGLNTLLSKVIREPLRAVSCLSIALWLNWRLTCLTLVLVPVSALTANRAGRVMKRAVRRSLESMSNIYKILQETFQGITVVKAFTQERRERRRFFRETKSLYKKSVRVATIDALSDPVLEMLSLSMVSIALLAGAYLVLNRTIFLDLGVIKLQLASQRMAIEDLLYLYSTLAMIADPVRKMANVHSRIQRAAAAADRICALMDRRPAVADRPGAVRLPRHKDAIEFDQVVFGYNGRDTVIRGVSLTVRHGETVALVGPNGCGKTTLLSLLPRFWDVESGAVRVDGHDVRDVSLRSLRRQIGMVLQDTILFEDTVANNIAYGNPQADRAAVTAAAKRAFAHQFITGLPEGYDTLIGERGLGLSGGQRQRIALARAMLRDPAILILDEATSAVDIQDEALIREAIEEFARDRTTLLITHSLRSLEFADRIVLMNAGRVEAVGTEAELRRASGLYRRLHEIHFQRESA